MPTDRELADLHVRALFTHDARSRLLRVNEPGSEAPAPRWFLGRTRAGNLWRFRADLPEALVEELEALCGDEPAGAELHGRPRHLEACVRLLEAHARVRRVWMGPAYRFTESAGPSRPLLAVTEANADLLRGGFEELVEELPVCQPFVALVEEGRAVSVCRSVRVTPAAHEAGVETLPDLRGKGYAKEVVAGWARSVRSVGAVPLYSTSWENTASRALAKKLRLVPFAADCHVT
ncbi:MAG TPA: GNAT family N-acetyltransferase [Planctomycetota bacterium]|nr:GNAT family N-acetyltransferase [Planctomycetota bacterium]